MYSTLVRERRLADSRLQIREGFIVDEEEEEEEEEEDQGGEPDGDARPPVKRKRSPRDREQEERLDDEDLELIGEQFGERPKSQTQVSKLEPICGGQY